MNKEKQSFFKRLAPYYVYLYNVKWTFLGGVLAGVLYGISSGLGIPLVTKYIFPILFNPDTEVTSPFNGTEDSIPQWLLPLFSPIIEKLESLFLAVNSMPQGQFLLLTCMLLPVTFLLRAVGGYFNFYLTSKAGLQVLEQIRAKVFYRLQQLSLSYYNENKAGEIMMKLQGASSQLRTSMMGTINDLIVQPITLIAAISFIISQAIASEGALPALIGVLGIPLAIIPIKIFGKKIRKKAKLAQLKGEVLSSFILQNIQSPLEVRTYNLQKAHHEHFVTSNNNLLRENLKMQKYSKLVTPAIEILAVVGLSLSIYLGVKSGMTLETFTALAAALYLAYEPVKKIGKLNSLIQRGIVSLDRLESILHSAEELSEPVKPLSLPASVRGQIAITNVSFTYKNSEKILHNLNLTIEPGEIIALVGASGSGKTTFMNLIPRLYDPTEGGIYLDGINLKDLSKKELREQIAIVPQMPTLFNLSIRENIAVGNPSATLDEIQEAAKHAYAHDFISALPQGYDTIVSESGTSLSGGQRQRVSIARAFLKNAPILLLDEATSALDNSSQEKITLALDKLMKGKTVIMIAHRESSLTSATRKLQFEQGRII